MTITTRYAHHPSDVKRYDSTQLRDHFLIDNRLMSGGIQAVHTMYDRFITLGIVPMAKKEVLPAFEEVTKASYFLERRELGIINLGGSGEVIVEGKSFRLNKKECLYIGQGNKQIEFVSTDPLEPAMFYGNSAPAHANYPTATATLKDANKVELGSPDTCNERVIYQYIHEAGIQSCQLVMGFTELLEGSIWNTFPPHTHTRRMEVYFYFDLPKDQVVLHLMGEPEETRHLVIRNLQGAISPEWSIHSGAGSASYSFVWGMAGENKAFTDMDGVDITNDLR